MTEWESAPSADEDGGLSFSHAELPVDAGVCGVCGTTLGEQYWAIDAVRTCEPCAIGVRDGRGSKFGRLLRASLFGAGAALFFTLIWYGILAATGSEFGLLAIVAGLGIGVAVRKGSDSRGGWGYQALAIALTYTSVVLAYVPTVADGIMHPNATAEAETAPALTTAPPEPSEAAVPSVVAYAVAVPLAFFVPFFEIFDGSGIIGFFILLIALYEAWKMNRIPRPEVAGPFTSPTA